MKQFPTRVPRADFRAAVAHGEVVGIGCRAGRGCLGLEQLKSPRRRPLKLCLIGNVTISLRILWGLRSLRDGAWLRELGQRLQALANAKMQAKPGKLPIITSYSF